MKPWLSDYREEFDGAFERFLNQDIENACQMIIKKLTESNVLIIGNGGSAAIAQHFATDWTKGIYTLTGKKSKALSLTTNNSIITATANDLRYEEVFSNQIEIIGSNADLLICISSSGESENILLAAQKARSMGISTIGLSGCNNSSLTKKVDTSLTVESLNIQVIEDIHSIFGHLVYRYAEKYLQNV